MSDPDILDDRTVHGIAQDGGAIVRYDRAGKWFVEYGGRQPRRAIPIGTAVLLATQAGAEAFMGLPGGGRFDAYVRQIDARRKKTEAKLVRLLDTGQGRS